MNTLTDTTTETTTDTTDTTTDRAGEATVQMTTISQGMPAPSLYDTPVFQDTAAVARSAQRPANRRGALVAGLAGAAVVMLAAAGVAVLAGGDDSSAPVVEPVVEAPAPDAAESDSAQGPAAAAASPVAADDGSAAPEPAAAEGPVSEAAPAAPAAPAATSSSSGASSPAPVASTGPCATYTEVTRWPIGLCSKGELVRDMQRLFNYANPDIAVDGLFGPATEAEVKMVQRGFGLPETGVMDEALFDMVTAYYLHEEPEERDAPTADPTVDLDPTRTSQQVIPASSPDFPCAAFTPATSYPLMACDSGDLVVELQENLNITGAGIVVDGFFGQSTYDAVRFLQSTQGMLDTGVADQVLRGFFTNHVGLD